MVLQGVPIRIEIGPRDVSSNCVVVSRRNIPGKAGKVFGISMEPSTLVSYGKEKLDEIQSSLLEKAVTFRDMYFFFWLYSYLVCHILDSSPPQFFCCCAVT